MLGSCSAFMPLVALAEVRFPSGRPTYADIPTPRGPAELVQRIEELERAVADRQRRRSDRWIRPSAAPGFSDAAERLGRRTFPPLA